MSHVRLQLPFAPRLAAPRFVRSNRFCVDFRQEPHFPTLFLNPPDVSTTAQGYRFMEVLIDTETGPASREGGALSGFKVHKN
jgi:hypothetical protein